MLYLQAANNDIHYTSSTSGELITTSAKGQPLVLVVEDHTINQKVARLMLEKIGFIVDIACTGEQALKMHANKQYDLIILDLGLPDISGITLCQIIRQDNPTIPILVITALADQKTQHSCLEAGASAIEVKPYTMERFQKVIEEVLTQTPTKP